MAKEKKLKFPLPPGKTMADVMEERKRKLKKWLDDVDFYQDFRKRAVQEYKDLRRKIVEEKYKWAKANREKIKRERKSGGYGRILRTDKIIMKERPTDLDWMTGEVYRVVARDKPEYETREEMRIRREYEFYQRAAEQLKDMHASLLRDAVMRYRENRIKEIDAKIIEKWMRVVDRKITEKESALGRQVLEETKRKNEGRIYAVAKAKGLQDFYQSGKDDGYDRLIKYLNTARYIRMPVYKGIMKSPMAQLHIKTVMGRDGFDYNFIRHYERSKVMRDLYVPISPRSEFKNLYQQWKYNQQRGVKFTVGKRGNLSMHHKGKPHTHFARDIPLPKEDEDDDD